MSLCVFVCVPSLCALSTSPIGLRAFFFGTAAKSAGGDFDEKTFWSQV